MAVSFAKQELSTLHSVKYRFADIFTCLHRYKPKLAKNLNLIGYSGCIQDMVEAFPETLVLSWMELRKWQSLFARNKRGISIWTQRKEVLNESNFCTWV